MTKTSLSSLCTSLSLLKPMALPSPRSPPPPPPPPPSPSSLCCLYRQLAEAARDVRKARESRSGCFCRSPLPSLSSVAVRYASALRWRLPAGVFGLLGGDCGVGDVALSPPRSRLRALVDAKTARQVPRSSSARAAMVLDCVVAPDDASFAMVTAELSELGLCQVGE